MTYVRPQLARYVMIAYVLGGLAIGSAVPTLKALATQHLGRPGYAVAFVVNAAMPFLIVMLAAIFPKMAVALGGTFVATLAFLVTTGLRAPPLNAGWLWSVLGQMGPILVIACLAYHAVAAATVVMVHPIRRVGVPPNPAACPGCGYLLIGVVGDRCPECGRQNSASSVGVSSL